MKKKIVVFTLCFTILFSSINYKKSYANPLALAPTVSPQMISTIGSLFVAVGGHILTDDDVLDVTRLFYEKNSSNWDNVVDTFNRCVVLGKDLSVSIGKEFLDIFKTTFDDLLSDNSIDLGIIDGWGYYDPVPLGYNLDNVEIISNNYKLYVNNKVLGVNVYYRPNIESGFALCASLSLGSVCKYVSLGVFDGVPSIIIYDKDMKVLLTSPFGELSNGSYSVVSLPSVDSYNWDNVGSRVDENGDVAVYVPGNLDTLVGLGSSDVFVGGYDLPVGGVVSSGGIANVLNPSVSIGDSFSIPSDSVIDSPGIDSPGIDSPGIDSPGGGLPEFPYWGEGLDFSPITESDISDKFPFCLAKDFGNLIGVFDVGEKEPVFDVPFLGEVYTIDLAQFTVWADIIKFFTLITFIFGLIKITRGIIG